MASGGWRVTAWSTEHGRGRIASDVGELDFDGHVAVVADFTVGEAVDVGLARDGASYRVTRIAPSGFRSPLAAAPPAPLTPAWRDAIAEIGALLQADMHDLSVAELRDGTLRIEVVDHEWDRRLGTISFDGVRYVQLPTRSCGFARVRGATWRSIATDAALVQTLGFGDEAFESDDVVVSLEPDTFGARGGLVVAATATVTVAPR